MSGPSELAAFMAMAASMNDNRMENYGYRPKGQKISSEPRKDKKRKRKLRQKAQRKNR